MSVQECGAVRRCGGECSTIYKRKGSLGECQKVKTGEEE